MSTPDALDNYILDVQLKQAAMNSQEHQAWLLALERERVDASWRTRPARQPAATQPTIVVIDKPAQPARENKKKREERDKLFFNAGRYAAGARDKTAQTAFDKLELEGEI